MSERATRSTVMQAAPVGGHELEELLAGPVETSWQGTRLHGALVGRLVAFTDGGAVPLVAYEGQPGSAALPARATLDLHGQHIGREVVLMLENADPRRPIIVGCLHDPRAKSLPEPSGQVEVDADGQRMVVSAKEQLVLRCGRASITLTRAGKLMIQGAYVSNRSSGVLRLKGGSVQIN